MVIGNCFGDNIEKIVVVRVKVRIDIKGCLYLRRFGVSVRVCGFEFIRLFIIFMGYKGCY